MNQKNLVTPEGSFKFAYESCLEQVARNINP